MKKGRQQNHNLLAKISQIITHAILSKYFGSTEFNFATPTLANLPDHFRLPEHIRKTLQSSTKKAEYLSEKLDQLGIPKDHSWILAKLNHQAFFGLFLRVLVWWVFFSFKGFDFLLTAKIENSVRNRWAQCWSKPPQKCLLPTRSSRVTMVDVQYSSIALTLRVKKYSYPDVMTCAFKTWDASLGAHRESKRFIKPIPKTVLIYATTF